MHSDEFYDAMAASNNPHHVPRTLMGNWASTMANVGRPSNAYLDQPRTFPASGRFDTGSSDGSATKHRKVPEESLAASVGIAIADLSLWLVRHVWPLQQIVDFGVVLADSSKRWKLNGPVALLGGLLLPALLLGSGAPWAGVGSAFVTVAGAIAPLLAFAVGALISYFVIPTLGLLIAMTVLLTVAAIVVVVLGVLVVAGFRALDAWLSKHAEPALSGVLIEPEERLHNTEGTRSLIATV